MSWILDEEFGEITAEMAEEMYGVSALLREALEALGRCDTGALERVAGELEEVSGLGTPGFPCKALLGLVADLLGSGEPCANREAVEPLLRELVESWPQCPP